LEFGTESPLVDLLKKILTGGPSNWQTIIRFISDLANGLEDLHRDIVHRYTSSPPYDINLIPCSDLHLGTVLVTSRTAGDFPGAVASKET